MKKLHKDHKLIKRNGTYKLRPLVRYFPVKRKGYLSESEFKELMKYFPYIYKDLMRFYMKNKIRKIFIFDIPYYNKSDIEEMLRHVIVNTKDSLYGFKDIWDVSRKDKLFKDERKRKNTGAKSVEK